MTSSCKSRSNDDRSDDDDTLLAPERWKGFRDHPPRGVGVGSWNVAETLFLLDYLILVSLPDVAKTMDLYRDVEQQGRLFILMK